MVFTTLNIVTTANRLITNNHRLSYIHTSQKEVQQVVVIVISMMYYLCLLKEITKIVSQQKLRNMGCYLKFHQWLK